MSTPSTIGAEVESFISYDWQAKLPGWTVVYEGERAGYRGITERLEKKITLYVRPGDSPQYLSEILAHELGHAIDLEHLNDADRFAWLEARGLPHVWWVGDGLPDFQVGQGDFAEAVAAVMVGSPSDSHHGEFSPEQLELARQLMS